MQTQWKLQDAKAKFSQVIDNAIDIGPQFVTRRGKEAVVIISINDYQNMIANKPSFNQFLLNCPKLDDDFEFERQKDYPREIEL